MAENEVLNVAKEYASRVRSVMDTRAVFLYGSHVRGTARKDSDIDIAVVVDSVQGDYLTAVSQLWGLTRSVSDEIEPVLLTPADDDSGFLTMIQRTGIAV